MKSSLVKTCLKSSPAVASHRRGQSTILMIFLMVALAGIMALTFDYGFLLLARRQMQTGVNAASLEGLRGQGLSDYDQDDEILRREKAQLLLRLNFDNDFDLATNPSTIGAGIDRSLVQGNGYENTTLGDGCGLSSMLNQRSNYVYRPEGFAMNLANQRHGDMVVGSYNDSDALHLESADYSRTDFDETIMPDAFLVRMRRTHNPDGLDELPGISSRGGGLPLMMGLLSWMSAEPDEAPYSVRRDGVVARAAAISQGKPATRVSPASPQNLFAGVAEITGTTPFMLRSSAWTTLPMDFPIDPDGSDPSDQVFLMGVTSLAADFSDSETTLSVSDASGFPINDLPFRVRMNSEIVAVEVVSGTTWTVTRGVNGTIPVSHDEHTPVINYAGRTTGEAAPNLVSLRPPGDCDLELLHGKSAHEYVPLIAEILGVDRIIGFGRVTWTWDSMTNTLDIIPLNSIVAPAATSATAIAPGLGQDELDQLLVIRETLQDILLSPVRVRTMR